MCYEFGLWSRKLRSDEQARKRTQKSEQVSKQPTPARQPVAAEAKEAKVQKRDTVPA